MSAQPKKIHHSAIVTNEVEKSLLFWTEGLGLSILMDEKFDGDWPKLFGATSTRLRSRPADLGLGGEPRVAEVAPGVRLCVVTDPNGVVVELMDGASEPVAGPT